MCIVDGHRNLVVVDHVGDDGVVVDLVLHLRSEDAAVLARIGGAIGDGHTDLVEVVETLLIERDREDALGGNVFGGRLAVDERFGGTGFEKLFRGAEVRRAELAVIADERVLALAGLQRDAEVDGLGGAAVRRRPLGTLDRRIRNGRADPVERTMPRIGAWHGHRISSAEKGAPQWAEIPSCIILVQAMDVSEHGLHG